MPGDTYITTILGLAKELGALRPRDLTKRGIPHVYLLRLYEKGQLQRTRRGIYRLPQEGNTDLNSLEEACARVPHGVICLLSALRFHEIGTQNPFEIWMAIDYKARRPKVDHPPLHIVRFSGWTLTEGVEEHKTQGGTLRVYALEKTIVDCFKYRNKIGLDIALEALRGARRDRRINMDTLWKYATMLRMANVMRPYLEAAI